MDGRGCHVVREMARAADRKPVVLMASLPEGRRRLAALCLLLAAAGCAAPPAAPPAAVTAAPARLEPEAEAALRRMSATVASAPAFALRLRTLREAYTPDGQRVLLGATGAVLARRPDRLHALVGSDTGNFGLWSDGRSVTLFNPDANLYGTAPLAGDMLAAADWLQTRMGIALAVRPLLAADPFAAMTAGGATTGRVLGPSIVGETPVLHLALRNPTHDWEIWLEAGPRALPMRVSMVERTPEGPVRTILEFEEWVLGPRLPDQAFRFAPPRGALPAELVPLPDVSAPGGSR
jgi:hypothetical protein